MFNILLPQLVVQKKYLISKLLFLLVIMMSVYACGDPYQNQKKLFLTWNGLEPDRWAAIWLIKTIISPDSEIIIKQAGSELSGGTLFAVPESKYKRTRESTAFSSLLKAYKVDDANLKHMSGILASIETASWSISGTDADTIEQSFRRLQERHGRYNVPINCYMTFFDEMYSRIKTSNKNNTFGNLMKNTSCDFAQAKDIKHVLQATVFQVKTAVLLDEISSGKEIIFIDAREEEEYREVHIPGAINIPLRKIDSVDLKMFESADRVVSYCIKDFRGYEVARALAEKGVRNSSTMKPYGLAGWKSLGLPVILAGQKEHGLSNVDLRNNNKFPKFSG